MFTFTSEVSRWQFFHDSATEEKSRFGWSNLPPWRARNMVVNGSCNIIPVLVLHHIKISTLT